MAVNIIEVYGMGNSQTVELTMEKVREVSKEMIETMKNGLPEETHTMDVFECVLSEVRQMLRDLPVKL